MPTIKTKFNPYAILGVPRTASDAEIGVAYRKLAKETHPDRHGGSADAAARFRAVTEARDELLDSGRRAALDRRLVADGLRAGKTSHKSGSAARKAEPKPEDILGEMMRRIREENRRRQVEQKERLANAFRKAVSAASAKPGPVAARAPVQQSHTPFFATAFELTKSRPADERFVWSMLGLAADFAVASR